MKSALMRTSAALTLAAGFGLGASGLPAAAQAVQPETEAGAAPAPDQAGGPPPATQPDDDPIAGEGTEYGTDADQAETDMPADGTEAPADTAADPTPGEIWEEEGEGIEGAAGGSPRGDADTDTAEGDDDG